MESDTAGFSVYFPPVLIIIKILLKPYLFFENILFFFEIFLSLLYILVKKLYGSAKLRLVFLS